MATISSIEGIGPAYAAKLREAGIRSTDALLSTAGNKRGRKALAERTGLAETSLLEWVNRADLMRVRGIGEEYSDLLEHAGVDTVRELSRRRADNLHQRCLEVSVERNLVRRPPSASMIRRWIDLAKTMEPAVTH